MKGDIVGSEGNVVWSTYAGGGGPSLLNNIRVDFLFFSKDSLQISFYYTLFKKKNYSVSKILLPIFF